MQRRSILVCIGLVVILAAGFWSRGAERAHDAPVRKPFGLDRRVPWTTSKVRGSPGTDCSTIDRRVLSVVEELRRPFAYGGRYYRLRGWSDDGVPSKAVVDELNALVQPALPLLVEEDAAVGAR